MRGHHFWLIPLFAACALIAIGCGDDDDGSSSSSSTTTSSASETAEASVDSAVKDCESKADDIGGAAGDGLKAACASVGDTAKKALESGSESAKEALAQAASSCKSAVSQLPSGDAQDALTSLCQAIESAE